MKLRNRIIMSLLITIFLVGIAILIWANQTGGITIWGDGVEEEKPTISMGLPVTLDGTLEKQNDYFVISNDKNYNYDIYFINSSDIKNSLDGLIGKEVEIYGSLGGNTDNELLVLWVDGKKIYDEDQARTILQSKLKTSVNMSVDSLSNEQKQCVFSIVSKNEYTSLISDPLTKIPEEKIEKINSCFEK